MRRVFLLLLVVCISCKPAPPPKKTAAAGPQVRATVVTIRTSVEKRTIDHALVIAGDKVRFTGENDTWRLYDTKARTVTLVDDVAKTTLTEPLDTILARRRTTNAAAIPFDLQRLKFVRTDESKVLQGVSAKRAVIESGAYRRELWLAEHPSIPRGLFAMMHASERQLSPLAPMTSAVDEALAGERGVPLQDRSTIGSDVIIERTVTAIAPRDVPEAMVSLPKGYTDIAPVARNPQR